MCIEFDSNPGLNADSPATLKRKKDSQLVELKEGVSQLQGLTGFGEEACLAAIMSSKGDVSAAAANMFERQEEVSRA